MAFNFALLLRLDNQLSRIWLYKLQSFETCLPCLLTGPAKTVKGVVGFSAELVCDVEPKVPDDQLQLVLWYKKGHKSPIYT